MTGVVLELTCAAIVVLFVVVRARIDPRPTVVLARLAALSIAAWLGEDTCIRLYGFYAYTPDAWTLWLDVTPLMIPLIWPVVIHSSWDLARHILGAHSARVVPVAAALVFADAAFIEPIAVHAGLWRWTEPGLLGVPPVGVLGWSLFALVALALLQHRPGLLERPTGWLVLVLVAPIGCHLLLLASWWGALRWVNHPVPVTPAIALAWVLSVGLTGAAVLHRVRARIPREEMFLRIPAALFFVGLLVLHREGAGTLAAWSLAFVPPYLACVDWTGRAGAPGP